MKTWKNLTELRKIAKEAGVKSVHKKDEATLLEALTSAGVEVSESAGNTEPEAPKAPEVPVVEPTVEEIPTEPEGANDADTETETDTQEETDAETTEAGTGRTELEECELRIAELRKRLDSERALHSKLIEEEAARNKPKTLIELLQESKAHNQNSAALKAANERRALLRGVQKGAPSMQNVPKK